MSFLCLMLIKSSWLNSSLKLATLTCGESVACSVLCKKSRGLRNVSVTYVINCVTHQWLVWGVMET